MSLPEILPLSIASVINDSPLSESFFAVDLYIHQAETEWIKRALEIEKAKERILTNTNLSQNFVA